jgi:hypothetical protein
MATNTGTTQSFSGPGVVQSDPTQTCWEFLPSDGSPLMTLLNPCSSLSTGEKIFMQATVKGTRTCSNLDWDWDNIVGPNGEAVVSSGNVSE